jgi:sulfur carrier protein ThiS
MVPACNNNPTMGTQMKVKVLCLGRSAKEIELSDGATVEQAIVEAGFPKDSAHSRHINGHPSFDSDVLQNGDVLTLVPQVKGG